MHQLSPKTISIHALLAESDIEHLLIINDTSDISIHALLAESDQRQQRVVDRPQAFLSTLSLRRATISTTRKIYTHIISIHALLAESD